MNFVSKENPDDDFYNVNIETIESYLISMETSMQKDGSVKRINTDIQAARWSGLKNFYDFLVKRGYMKINPVEQTSRPNTSNNEHSVTYLTKQEIKKIMACIDQNTSETKKLRDKAIVGLGLGTGLRISALIGINLEDIDWENGVIHVVEKRNKIRAISIGENTQELLKAWIKERNKNTENLNTTALFVSQKNNRMSVDAVSDLLKKYTNQAGISKKITPHRMRSSAATNMAAAGVSIQAIAKQLGHSNINITQRYVDVLKDEQEKTLKVLDNLY
jgi:site-specific recombinase XerD